MAPHATSARRKVGMACDRCYQLKERCMRSSAESCCARCRRLGQICLTVRPAKPAGRRPQHRHNVSSQIVPSSTTPGPNPVPDIRVALHDIFSTLEPDENELLALLLGQPHALQRHVASPSFEEAEQCAIVAPLPTAWPILKDAYLAYAGMLRSLHLGGATEEEEKASLRRASSALIALRSLSVTSPEDATLCLALGHVLASFAYAVVGVGVYDICQYCLGSARPFIESSSLSTDAESRITFLVLMEIMESTVHRRKPTMRPPPRTSRSIDRYLGLCLPLLPHYHDLCVISCSLARCTDASHIESLHHQLDYILALLTAWQPSGPDDFLLQFGPADVIILLAQAKVYRLAALLLAHRLRHVFGQNDTQADLWSHEIMTELEMAQRIAKRPVRFVTMPFITAAVEIQDPVARIKAVQNVDNYVDQFTPVVRRATKSFLSRVWRDRDQKITYFWLDSIHKPCVVLDSMDTAISDSFC